MDHPGSLLIKYRLHHIPLWVLYHYVWWVVAMGNPIKAANLIFNSPQAVTFVFYVIFQAFAVYFNIYYLIPRYLEKSKFLKYLGILGVTILSAALFIVAGYYLSASIFGIRLDKVYKNGTDCFFFFFGEAFPSTVASTTLAMSIKLAKDWIGMKTVHVAPEKSDADHFFVKSGTKFEKIFFDDIIYIEGMQNYVTIYTVNNKHITLLNMKTLEQNLSDHGFIRTHKSYIVSLSKIDGIEGNDMLAATIKIPISRTYRKKVMDELLSKQLWAK
jgi:hypothetical protein